MQNYNEKEFLFFSEKNMKKFADQRISKVIFKGFWLCSITASKYSIVENLQFLLYSSMNENCAQVRHL